MMRSQFARVFSAARGQTVWDAGGTDANVNTAANWNKDTLPAAFGGEPEPAIQAATPVEQGQNPRAKSRNPPILPACSAPNTAASKQPV